MMTPRLNNGGNALFMIMIAIFLVGLLSKTMIEKDLETGHISDYAAEQSDVANIQSHETALKLAVTNLLSEGISPTNIDPMDPEDPDFDVAPHTAKLYHPYGGGAQYQQYFSGWNNIKIHSNAAITDVGPTSGIDIIAVGDVSEDLCYALSDGSVPVVTQPAIDALQDGTTAVTLDDGTTCTSGTCNAIGRQCVRNSGSTEFVFYSLLHAQ